jgi:hypothetical protein
MIPHVLADTGKVRHNVDVELPQSIRRPDTRHHQELRTLKGTGAHNNLLPRIDRQPYQVQSSCDSHASGLLLSVEYDLLGLGSAEDLQVGTGRRSVEE